MTVREPVSMDVTTMTDLLLLLAGLGAFALPAAYGAEFGVKCLHIQHGQTASRAAAWASWKSRCASVGTGLPPRPMPTRAWVKRRRPEHCIGGDEFVIDARIFANHHRTSCSERKPMCKRRP